MDNEVDLEYRRATSELSAVKKMVGGQIGLVGTAVSRLTSDTLPTSTSLDLVEKLKMAEKNFVVAERAFVTLNAEIEAEVQKRLSEYKAKYNGIAPNLIAPTATAGNCHVGWSPDTQGTTPYVFYKLAGKKVLSPVTCETIEIVQKKQIQAVPKE